MICLVSPETSVPSGHPIRAIKQVADAALRTLSSVFDQMYAATGRPSVPPERLLKGQLLIALYSIRSERQLSEQLEYNLLFRWFLDMDMLEPAFDASTYSRNRDRLMSHDVAAAFFAAVRDHGQDLMSHEHFSVDGTLIEAWASLKSFRRKDEKGPKDGDGSGGTMVDFRGEKRSNETHESTTDPESKLMRKGLGKEAKLSFGAHALMENRNGLLVDFRISDALTRNEREVGLAMLADVNAGAHPTVGGDRGYNHRAFVDGCRERGFSPHVAQKKAFNAIDRRTTRHSGYEVSQWIRKRVEEIFGWMKTVGGFRRTRYKGRARTQAAGYIVGAAYNLVRIAKLKAAHA